MNTIDTSNVIDPNQEQPWKSTSLQFLEDSEKETFNNVVRSLIGSTYSTSQVYILWGCVRSGTADGGSGAVSVTAGAIFFNGEIYTVDAFSGTLVANNLYSAVSVTVGSPDPTAFSNGASFSIHNVRKWLPVVAGSGSNLVSGWIPIGRWTNYTPTISVDGSGSASGTATGWYKFEQDTLTISIAASSVVIGSGTITVTFSIPTIFGNPGNKQTWGVAYNFDGTIDRIRTSTFPSSSGSGVIGLSGTSWTVGSAQLIYFTMVIRLA